MQSNAFVSSVSNMAILNINLDVMQQMHFQREKKSYKNHWQKHDYNRTM